MAERRHASDRKHLEGGRVHAARLPSAARTRLGGRYDGRVALRTETIHVSGVRCERCVMRLGGALSELDGLEAANANLMGDVSLTWDDERLDREAIVATLAGAGFRPAADA